MIRRAFGVTKLADIVRDVRNASAKVPPHALYARRRPLAPGIMRDSYSRESLAWKPNASISSPEP